MASVLNINVGVLGHVDSGKTSLSKALSTTASTACYDKNPQSKERGITLDLGFSSFQIQSVPTRFQAENRSYDRLQFTLVDCPGHASLIKTIIGGSQIIDVMMLVIDIVKGIQTQTAECLVIGEITCNKLIVVLNKVDLIPEAKRDQSIEKMKRRILKVMEATKFKEAPIVCVAAKPEGESPPIGLEHLIETLTSESPVPSRSGAGDFVFAVDHCFGVRGQGTVMTGTVLSGSVRVGDTVEISALKTSKKVKSMQMFRQPVDLAIQGDRLGICVTQFDPSLLERGVVCSPGALPTLYAAVLRIRPIPYFKTAIASKSKFHLTIGHETVMARIMAFGGSSSAPFSFDQEYPYLEELSKETDGPTQFLLTEFERPIVCRRGAVVIGSRLDADIHAHACRLAFEGHIEEATTNEDYRTSFLPRVKVFKWKSRSGVVERAPDARSVIVRSLFKKETNMDLFNNLQVTLSSGQAGVIEGSFGQSGKCKVRLHDDLPEDLLKKLGGGRKKNKEVEADSGPSDPVSVELKFKRFVFDPKKRMIQS